MLVCVLRRGMLVSDQVRECLCRAEDCVQRAASQSDPKLRQDYLIIAACWLKLSQEVSELPANFSKPERQAQQFKTPVKLKASMEGSSLAQR